MRQIHESLTNPADHLALDEAALQLADEGVWGETIRLWELDQTAVVLGRSSKVDFEVDRDYCRSRFIPILRRCSGGASIVAGPGCLMYSVVLSLERNPALRRIDAAHTFVMNRVAEALRRHVPDVQLQGICDLTLGDRKFSGNALRIARSHLLYHGTLLYAADLECLVSCLRNAPRQPDYRERRDHHDFVTNVTVDARAFSDTLLEVFDVDGRLTDDLPMQRIHKLRAERYDADDWNFRH